RSITAATLLFGYGRTRHVHPGAADRYLRQRTESRLALRHAPLFKRTDCSRTTRCQTPSALIDPHVRRPPAEVPAVTPAVDATHSIAARRKNTAKRFVVLPRFIVVLPSGPTGDEESH